MAWAKTIAITSGYFNPWHAGHRKLLDGASDLADRLIVIINNDAQQLAKKGRIYENEDERAENIRSLAIVDYAIIAIDSDATVCESLRFLANQHRLSNLIFANGGDRTSEKDIPETKVCREFGIELAFGVGGAKFRSSSEIVDDVNDPGPYVR